MDMAAKETHPCKVVLIVDDEPLLRMAAAGYLTDAGFEVVEAGSADEAMRVLDERKDISVLFSDIQMPGSMDGVSLATLVAIKWPFIKVLLTSGNITPSARSLPHKVLFLAKPYDLRAVATVAA
jgi:DNA-binding NtrC family response regulator